MIDDYARATALVDKMRAHLPIPIRPGSPVLKTLRDKGVTLGRDAVFRVKQVYYSGDEGGIMCDVTPDEAKGVAIVVSLTHLFISADHPLAGEIRAYQRERIRRLALSAGSHRPRADGRRPPKKGGRSR